ncbi:hypothetical protein ACJX0J_019457 [Zea mays]
MKVYFFHITSFFKIMVHKNNCTFPHSIILITPKSWDIYMKIFFISLEYYSGRQKMLGKKVVRRSMIGHAHHKSEGSLFKQMEIVGLKITLMKGVNLLWKRVSVLMEQGGRQQEYDIQMPTCHIGILKHKDEIS